MQHKPASRSWMYVVGAAFVLWTSWCGLMAQWPNPFANPLPRAFARLAVVLVPAFVYAFILKTSGNDGFHLRTNGRRGIAYGIAATLILLGPVLAWRLHSSKYDWRVPVDAAVWLNWIIGSPFAEEALFRTIVLQELLVRMKTWFAVMIASVLFTVFHLPWWAISGERQGWMLVGSLAEMFGYGVIFSVLFCLTKSIWAPLIPHVANNFIGQCLVRLLP